MASNDGSFMLEELVTTMVHWVTWSSLLALKNHLWRIIPIFQGGARITYTGHGQHHHHSNPLKPLDCFMTSIECRSTYVFDHHHAQSEVLEDVRRNLSNSHIWGSCKSAGFSWSVSEKLRFKEESNTWAMGWSLYLGGANGAALWIASEFQLRLRLDSIY